ncbi:hypothetical protein ACQ4M3_20725 [Leptolyngbya sp. AN03gr2]|uniref:hypothetical protein n=1 Tax=unclassified Leptolyngbya TaxID=2650499 RepID=UPI003D31B844
MALKTIRFNNVQEADAFVTGVFWVNDSTISLVRAARHTDGTIELFLNDTDSKDDHIPPLQIKDILQTIEQATPVYGMIEAECWSDDTRIEVKFNAAPYFAQALIEDILALEQCSWARDYACDNVAEFCENLNSEVERMFTYIRSADLGFECSIDRRLALNWLQQYRPELFTKESPLQSLLNNSEV